jgi:hypothetical protein
MLEAVTTDLVFTISLKRSTQNLQLSTSWAGRLPHLCAKAEVGEPTAIVALALHGTEGGTRCLLLDCPNRSG